jgi:TPR repeat protein
VPCQQTHRDEDGAEAELQRRGQRGNELADSAHLAESAANTEAQSGGPILFSLIDIVSPEEQGETARSLKFSADQGNADAQYRYGVCLREGIGISRDLQGAARYFKLSADQGNADGQWLYGLSLRDGSGISRDLQGAARYFKLSADQGNAAGRCGYGVCLRDGIGISRDLQGAARYFKLPSSLYKAEWFKKSQPLLHISASKPPSVLRSKY